MAAHIHPSLSYLKEAYGKKIKVSKGDAILDAGNGKKITGITSIAKYFQRTADEFKALSLEQRMTVEQWIDYARTEVCDSDPDRQAALTDLNKYLEDKVYIVNNNLTIADVILFHRLHAVFTKLTFQEKEKFMNVSRWFNHIQQNSTVRQLLPLVTFLRTPVYDGVSSH